MKYAILFLLCATMIVTAQDKKLKEDAKVSGPVTLVKEKEKKQVKDGEMKEYFLVLLKRGPNRSHDSTTAAEIQKGHMANILRLYNEGKMDIAGPMGYDEDLRGIFIFNCASYGEVLELCATDPAVKAGRLVAEIHSWWAEKGAKLR
jgi:uncharacterized protein YciI